MATTANEHEYLTVDDLADLLAVPKNTIYFWRHNGDGPRGIRVGRHVRFRRTDVDEWLESCRDQEAA